MPDKPMDAEKSNETDQNLTAAGDRIGKFLEVMLGDAAKELGGVVSDWARYFRLKNLLVIQDKVEAIHQRRKREGRTTPVPPGLAIEIIDAASKEDDENLQRMWAGLIANATDPESTQNARKVFVRLLQSMDPADAIVLEWMSNQGWGNPLGRITLSGIATELQLQEDEVKLSLDNLSRLDLIDVGTPLTYENSRDVRPAASNESSRYKVSDLGWALIKACRE